MKARGEDRTPISLSRLRNTRRMPYWKLSLLLKNAKRKNPEPGEVQADAIPFKK